MKLKEIKNPKDIAWAEYEMEDCNRAIESLAHISQTLDLEDQLLDATNTHFDPERIHKLSTCIYAIRELKVLLQDRRSWASEYLGEPK